LGFEISDRYLKRAGLDYWPYVKLMYHLTINDFCDYQQKSGGRAIGFTVRGSSSYVRNHFYYPDIIVTCDDRDRETATYKSFPKLIIEVLSDSTEAFDRGDKFNDYQTLESLEEYVLVNSKHQRVETFRRGEQGLWILQTYQEESFSLQSINLTASFRDLYEDVTLETVNYSVEEIE